MKRDWFMNVERTKQYYDQLTDADICNCIYCRNYVKEIRSACPELTVYLGTLGIDIEKPFEAIPIGPAEGVMLYSGVQYVVMGKSDDFMETSIGNARVTITDDHPMTEIEEDHFVIEISPITVKWNGEQ